MENGNWCYPFFVFFFLKRRNSTNLLLLRCCFDKWHFLVLLIQTFPAKTCKAMYTETNHPDSLCIRLVRRKIHWDNLFSRNATLWNRDSRAVLLKVWYVSWCWHVSHHLPLRGEFPGKQRNSSHIPCRISPDVFSTFSF